MKTIFTILTIGIIVSFGYSSLKADQNGGGGCGGGCGVMVVGKENSIGYGSTNYLYNNKVVADYSWGKVYKFLDPDNIFVTCYVYVGKGISCVKN